MTNIIIKPSFKIITAPKDFDITKINAALNEVAPLYPDFEDWFNNKFLPSFYVGKREILYAYSDDKLCGISLIKKTEEENKLCTFYILSEARGKGLGSDLLDKSLEYFQNESTIISVSNERLTELYPMLSSKGFVLDNCIEHMYRHENIEHFFKTK